MKTIIRWLAAAGLGALLALPGAAWADREADARKAFADAREAAKAGPQDIALADQGVLHLPAERLFVPQPQAGALLNAMGNPGHDPRLQGLVFPQGDAGWFVTVRFEGAGYIKDDDARDWNADELLKNLREGTDAANAEREKQGIAPIEILGWAEKPAYDAKTHRLTWSLSSREKGSTDGAPQGVNYNTYALGRDGYFSFNLVTGLADLPAHRPAAHALLAALEYKDGKRYADFNASTDRVAEYGLAALVAGVAAKKLGFFALAVAFIAKFAKVILLALAAFGGVVFKGLRKPKAAPAAAASDMTVANADVTTTAAPPNAGASEPPRS